MPVKSTTATPAKSTTPRKRRTRKTTTTATKSVAKVTTKKATPSPKVTTTAPKIEQKKVTVTTFQSGKVVNKSTELVKPNAPLIQMRDYQRDITNRWNIHHYEMQELVKDVRGFVNNILPYYRQLVKSLQTT